MADVSQAAASGILGVQSRVACACESWSSRIASVGSLDRANQPFWVSTGLADCSARYSWRGIGIRGLGKTPDLFLRFVYCDDQGRRTVGQFSGGTAAVYCLSET